MFKLNQRESGFVIHLEGMLSLEKAQRLQFQLRDEWAGMNAPFCLLVDARGFRYFKADAQALFETILEEAVQAGLQRITVVAVSTGLASVFCNSMVRADLMHMYQFMDIAYEPKWKAEVEEWLMEPFTASTGV
jgi:anti-anti-sigma regulatory factor